MRANGFSDRAILWELKAAHRQLRLAFDFLMDNKPEFANISMSTAADHLAIVLGKKALAA